MPGRNAAPRYSRTKTRRQEEGVGPTRHSIRLFWGMTHKLPELPTLLSS
jgi:hypothetical protein